MTRIVIYAHRPKRTRRKKAQATALTGSAIVTATSKRGEARRREMANDDGREVDPEVKAFFARMMRPPGA